MHGQVAAVALYTEFKHPASAAVVASLEQEAASIMAPLGLDLEWKSLAGFRAGESARRLVVTTFRGTCDTRGLMPAPVESSGLGWIYITDGELQSFIAVDCDRIRAFVRGPLYRTDPRDRDRILGRAIGRVIAHELYHTLGRTTHHGSGRVGHAAYTVRELIDEDTPIDQERVPDPAL